MIRITNSVCQSENAEQRNFGIENDEFEESERIILIILLVELVVLWVWNELDTRCSVLSERKVRFFGRRESSDPGRELIFCHHNRLRHQSVNTENALVGIAELHKIFVREGTHESSTDDLAVFADRVVESWNIRIENVAGASDSIEMLFGAESEETFRLAARFNASSSEFFFKSWRQRGWRNRRNLSDFNDQAFGVEWVVLLLKRGDGRGG